MAATARALLATALFPGAVSADVLFQDKFDYTVGERLGSGSSLGSWDNPKSNITIAESSLSYPGLPASTGQRVQVDGGTSNLDGARTITDSWPSQTSGSLYLSFILRIDDTRGIATGGTGTPIVNISRAGSASRQLISINLVHDGALRAGVLKYPSSSSPVSSSFFATGPGAVLAPDGSTTYLIVAKYHWVGGDENDVATLWVNPDPLGETEDTENRVSTDAGTDGTSNAGRLYINRGPVLSIDALRLGQTWADVTSPDGPMAPQPHITDGFISEDGLVLRGTNGAPSSTYQVVAATRPLAPSNPWISVSTNIFDTQGNFDTTNPLPVAVSHASYGLLLGGELPMAPVITSQPMDRTVLAGRDASFQVAATGTAPLDYQWFFEGIHRAGATGATYVVSNAQTNDAGGYSVVIANSIGMVTSVVATLAIAASPTVGTPDAYATLGRGTTGGAGGATVTVSTLAEFESYVGSDSPYVVQVQGTINLGGSNLRVRDDKTIIGIGTDATLVGDLKVFRNNNVILQNLTFTNPGGVGDGDGLSLSESENVWVDHCTFVDCDDGNLDITHASDWITVSWCHFYYTDPGNDHRFSNLIGHSDNNAAEDTGKLHITFHHNRWGQLVHERMPRVRFGRVHLYNNYYDCPGNNYCIRAARDCEIRVENNYFDTVKNVWELYRTEGIDGKVFADGNLETNTYWAAGGDLKSIQIPGSDVLSSEPHGLNPVPYAYPLHPPDAVPALVSGQAGAGKGPFAP